nr:RDD family protein [Pseudomonadota bacterium]
LEAQLAEARKPRPLQWRDDAMRRLHRLGLRFGWAIAYFSLLPFWWKGQTVGKRLFGLRVVELTGKPLGLMTAGGYAAGLATGGMGFLQVLWDPNRQAVEDKLAHTVVVDLRGPRAPTPRIQGHSAPENEPEPA